MSFDSSALHTTQEREHKGYDMNTNLFDHPRFRQLTTTERFVLMSIRTFDDGNRGCLLTVKALSKFVGVSPRQVQRILSDLEAANLIEVDRSGRVFIRRVSSFLFTSLNEKPTT